MNSSTRMNPLGIPKKNIQLSRIKRRILGHVWLSRIGALTGIVLILYTFFLLFGFFAARSGTNKYFSLLSGFVLAKSDSVKSINGRTNIVVLGKAGKGHSGGDLTDTMMLVSVTPKSVKLVSIPRDIWIPEIRAKINSAYYWGNEKTSGGGLTMAKSLVEEVTGQPVQYALVLDFNGFKKIIDVLDGIDIYIDRSFVDEKYPLAGKENDPCGGDILYKCRYETLTFTQGLTHMDGETALKYVRSRNAVGDEGTDLARERRQQKVISAIKEAIFSPRNLLNIKKDLAVLEAGQSLIETDMDEGSLAVLARRILGIRSGMASQNIPQELLVNPPESQRYDYQYVFIPKGGSWGQIHEWINGALSD